jgi:hypothetical protein
MNGWYVIVGFSGTGYLPDGQSIAVDSPLTGLQAQMPPPQSTGDAPLAAYEYFWGTMWPAYCASHGVSRANMDSVGIIVEHFTNGSRDYLDSFDGRPAGGVQEPW